MEKYRDNEYQSVPVCCFEKRKSALVIVQRHLGCIRDEVACWKALDQLFHAGYDAEIYFVTRKNDVVRCILEHAWDKNIVLCHDNASMKTVTATMQLYGHTSIVCRLYPWVKGSSLLRYAKSCFDVQREGIPAPLVENV